MCNLSQGIVDDTEMKIVNKILLRTFLTFNASFNSLKNIMSYPSLDDFD